VSPQDYEANLREVLNAAAEAKIPVRLLAFPMQQRPTEHLAILQSLGPPVLAPELGPEAFFSDDPIHLNEAGNFALAEALFDPINAALFPSVEDDSTPLE
jgi:lysophospholipase L1-like esterase